MLKSMGSQRVGQDWVTELKWMHSNRKQDKVYAFSLDNIQIIESWSTLVDLMTNLIIFNFPLFYFVGVLCNKKELTTNYIIPSMSLNLRKLVASPDLWFILISQSSISKFVLTPLRYNYSNSFTTLPKQISTLLTDCAWLKLLVI